MLAIMCTLHELYGWLKPRNWKYKLKKGDRAIMAVYGAINRQKMTISGAINCEILAFSGAINSQTWLTVVTFGGFFAIFDSFQQTVIKIALLYFLTTFLCKIIKSIFDLLVIARPQTYFLFTAISKIIQKGEFSILTGEYTLLSTQCTKPKFWDSKIT